MFLNLAVMTVPPGLLFTSAAPEAFGARVVPLKPRSTDPFSLP